MGECARQAGKKGSNGRKRERPVLLEVVQEPGGGAVTIFFGSGHATVDRLCMLCMYPPLRFFYHVPIAYL